MTSEYEDFAKRIKELEDRIAGMASSQLARSSLENAAIPVYDGDGQLSALFGRQADGSFMANSVSGPVPPVPAGLTVTPIINGFRLTWDGTWEGGESVVVPSDFARVEFHVKTSPGILKTDRPANSTDSPRGGEALAIGSPDTDYWFALTARSQSGKVSERSAVVGPVKPLKIEPHDINVDFEALGGTTVFYGPTEPTTTRADLWLKTPQNIAYRFDPATDQWVEVADQRIAQALLDAQEAENKAVQAGIDALAAGSAASAARGTADNAASAASAASTLANQARTAADSKITVYRQPSAPTGGTYKPQGDLWIDSDDGKIYVATTTTGGWLETSDTRIATALSTATTANTTANSKITVFAQVSAPATTGRTMGDVWYDTDDHNRMYVWDGAWTARTFGIGAVLLTARQLGAITTYRQASAPAATGLILGDFWIDSDDNVLYRWEGATPAWVKVQDANIQAAITSAATAQSTADGKMRIFPQASAPTGLVAGDAGDMWIDTDDANKTYTWTGTVWEARLLGNAAIQPKSLVARDVVATGTVSAALLEALMVLTNTLVVGNPTGDRVTISGINNTTGTSAGIGIQQVTGGVVTFNLAPGGSAYFAGVLSGRSTNYAEANQGWQLSEEGDFNVQNVNVFERMTANSVSTSKLDVRGVPIESLLTIKPQGLIAQGYDDAQNIQGIVAETGIAELGFMADPGRGYRIEINGPEYGTSDDNSDIGFFVRRTLDGTAPTVNSPVVATMGQDWGGFRAARFFRGSFLWYPEVASRRQVRLLFSFARTSGAGTVGVNCVGIRRLQIFVEDIGAALPNSMRRNNSTLSAPPPPPPAPVQYYQETYYTTWTASFRQDNSKRISNGDMYQGYADGFNGRQGSMMGFELTYIRPRLAGANIKWAKFYMLNRHTWQGTGAEVLLGTHGVDFEPATFYAHPALWERRRAGWTGRGGWCEIDCTDMVIEMVNATNSGFVIGYPTTTGTQHYGYWVGQNGGEARPRFVVAYEK